jgi:hypothetical protein
VSDFDPDQWGARIRTAAALQSIARAPTTGDRLRHYRQQLGELLEEAALELDMRSSVVEAHEHAEISADPPRGGAWTLFSRTPPPEGEIVLVWTSLGRQLGLRSGEFHMRLTGRHQRGICLFIAWSPIVWPDDPAE